MYGTTHLDTVDGVGHGRGVSGNREPCHDLAGDNLAVHNHLQPTKAGNGFNTKRSLHTGHGCIFVSVYLCCLAVPEPLPFLSRSTKSRIIDAEFSIAAPREEPVSSRRPQFDACQNELCEVAVYDVVERGADAVEIDQCARSQVADHVDENVSVGKKCVEDAEAEPW